MTNNEIIAKRFSSSENPILKERTKKLMIFSIDKAISVNAIKIIIGA